MLRAGDLCSRMYNYNLLTEMGFSKWVGVIWILRGKVYERN